MAKGPQKRSAPALGAALASPLKLAWWALVVCLPLLGTWIASSLAAYANRPPWAAALAGLLLFPIAPCSWEAFAAFRRRGAKLRRFLTLGDRVILRTLALNLAFLAVVLGASPRDVFAALTVRGDWALEGRSGPRVDEARHLLFALAGRLEWLYLYAKEKNPYGESDGGPAPGPSSDGASPARAPALPATPPGSSTSPIAPPPAAASSPAVSSPPSAPTPPTPAGGPSVAWPLPNQLHPLVASLPPEHETSPASVARYLAERERDPVMLVKALHDYVADRIAYDVPAYLSMNLPDQGADRVFAERKGVCAGYARLFAELGRLAGLEVAYVVGNARDVGGDIVGLSHAWNAVRLGDAWHLVDVTWDAGALDGAAFAKGYQSDYLLTPPAIFGRTHLPENPSWQLRPDPLSRGDFLRQPNLRPSFFALGLSLLEPDRSQITVARSFDARLEDPGGISLLAAAYDKTSGAETACEVAHDPGPRVRCDLPAPGTYHVRLFGSQVRKGAHPFIGQIEVNREPLTRAKLAHASTLAQVVR